jgi:hypothetical protein
LRAARGGVLLALLVGGAATVQAIAAVRASLDSSQIAVGDTVQLTLEHDGRTSGQPDLTPLQPDFDILGTSSSTSFELFNGSASEKSQVILTLAPKVTGHLTIPALSWGGEKSQPLSLMVTGPGIGPQTGSPAPAARVFIRTSVSPRQPYVEAAVDLTARLFTSETLYHADLEMPASGDVLVKQVGTDQNTEVERNGRSYQVVTRHYLLFPMHSGRLTLPGPVLDAEVATSQRRSPFDPFGGAFFGGPLLAGPVRVYGDPIVLDVRPRPAAAIGSYWLPARDVTLSSAWNPAKLSAQAGDPLTLDVDVQASGLTAAQLPDIASLLNVPAGLKAYPDQPKLNDSAQNGTLIGSRDQTIALMAESPGQYTIPALTIAWWDTQTNQPRMATLPARTLTILPAPGGAAATTAAAAAPAGRAPPVTARGAGATPTTPGGAPLPRAPARRLFAPRLAPSGPPVWEWISIALALVWLATLGAWLWSRRSRAAAATPHEDGMRSPAPSPRARHAPPDASKERAAFRAACEANDAHAARAHLLAWSAAVWDRAPAGIGAIAATIPDATVAELLRDLDRACYAGGGWQGRPLAAALGSLPTPPGKSGRERDGLAPLYP